MASFADGKIQAFVGPLELGAADDLERVIVNFIAGAKTRLDIAVQEIDSRTIAQAILDARWRGCGCRCSWSRTICAATWPATPPSPRRLRWGRARRRRCGGCSGAATRPTWPLTGRSWRPCCVPMSRSRGTTTPRSSTRSSSWVTTTARPPQPRRCCRVGQLHLDRHPQQPQQRVRLRQRLCLPPVPHRGRAAGAGQLRPGPAWRGAQTDDLAGVPVRVLFAPDHTPELEIMKQLLKGSRECYFAIFTFAGSSGIDDAMLALARGGMQLKGALDPGQAAQDGAAAPKWLKHPNIELYVPKRQGAFARLRKLHHKLMVMDERIVVAGSFNSTQPANAYNDENIFVMGSTHKEVEGIEVEADASRQLAVHLKQEIERIISLSKRYDPAA